MAEELGVHDTYKTIATFAVLLTLVIAYSYWKDTEGTLSRIAYPLGVSAVMYTFLKICEQAQHIVQNDIGSPYSGINVLVTVAMVLLVFDTVSTHPTLRKRFELRKTCSNPSAFGVFLTLGAGSIVFGFLDNFGMKLGTDALEGSVFKSIGKSLAAQKSAIQNEGAFKNIARRYIGDGGDLEGVLSKEYAEVARVGDTFGAGVREKMREHIDIMAGWAKSDGNKVINHAIRLVNTEVPLSVEPGAFKERLLALTEALSEMKDSMKEVVVPPEWNLSSLGTKVYLKDVRERFSTIQDASSMLGNTFSDFLGALLGAGVGKLFAYLTAVDGDVSNHDDTVNGIAIRFIQNPVVRVVLEAFFIGVGCLIPVFMHYNSRDVDVHKTGIWVATFLKNATLIFVLVCIILAGVTTAPKASECTDKGGDLPFSQHRFWTGVCTCLVFFAAMLAVLHSLNKET